LGEIKSIISATPDTIEKLEIGIICSMLGGFTLNGVIESLFVFMKKKSF